MQGDSKGSYQFRQSFIFSEYGEVICIWHITVAEVMRDVRDVFMVPGP